MNEAQDPARAARLQAWNAVQWLARLARSYAGDGAELRWVAPGRIVTPEITPGIAVGLELATLVLQFDEAGARSPHPLELDDKSSSEVEAWILVEMLHRGIERERFSKALPYTPAQLMSGEEPKYLAQDFVEELRSFGEELDAAADTLMRTREKIGGDDGGLVCRPEHLAIGFTLPGAGVPIDVAYASGATGAARGFRVLRGGDASELPPDVPPGEAPARLAQLVAEMRAG